MPEDDDKSQSWFDWGAKHGRDLLTYITLSVLVMTVSGYLLRDSITFRNNVADLAGTVALRAEIAKLSVSIDNLGLKFDQQNEEAKARSETAAADRKEVIDRVASLEKTVALDMDPTPPVTFMNYGHRVENAADPEDDIHIGDTVRITWQVLKTRDCGLPHPADFIEDDVGVQAQLLDPSTRNKDGTGMALPPSPTPRTLTYTAKIPDMLGLVSGRAHMWLQMEYDREVCPKVGTIDSPRVEIDLKPAVRLKG
jgi:hypothetical protein